MPNILILQIKIHKNFILSVLSESLKNNYNPNHASRSVFCEFSFAHTTLMID